MKRIWLILCCICSFYSYAQQGSLIGNIDVKKFPEISFVWNEYNPDVLDSTKFSVKENGQSTKISVSLVTPDSIPHKNKSILFLWDNRGDKDQYDFTQALLFYFFRELKDSVRDRFNIAIFNRKSSNDNYLGLRLPDFTSDKDTLGTFISVDIESAQTQKGRNDFDLNDNDFDLLFAIKNGIQLLKKEPEENIKIMIVVSSGFSSTLTHPIDPILALSLPNKIPVYFVYYPVNNYAPAAQIAIYSRGQFIIAGEDYNVTKKELLNCYKEIDKRHYGQDYKITFTSLQKRDNRLYPFILHVNDTDYPLHYVAPGFSLIVWAKQHLILFWVLLAVVIAAITMGIIFGIKFFKERSAGIRTKKQEEERQKARQSAEQDNLKRNLNATREELQRQQKAAEQEKEQYREQEQEERLTKLMHTKNLLPRLFVVNEGITFNINKTTTTIGKSNDNDIVVTNDTVSRHHAQIVFNGLCFEIYDLQSSNGIIVNGNYVESAELKSADIIQLGEVIIKFYL